MYLAFEEAVAGFAVEVIWQRLEPAPDERLIVGVTERQRVGARQEPAEHAVSAGIVPRAFVINAATAEGIEHEPRTGDAAAPERLIEEHRDPQIVARPVVVSHMLSHRASQPHAGPFDRVQPRMRQRDDQSIEVVPHNVSALPDRNDVAIARCIPPVVPVALFTARNSHNWRVENHVGAGETLRQPSWQHIHPAID